MTHPAPLAEVPATSVVATRPLTAGLAVVVCTYKRPGSLKGFLDSLAAQDRRPEQLIIVDASPSDDTEHMVRDYRDFNALADQAQYFHVSEPYVGLTRQRNFAVRLVDTDLVAFFDDDIVLLPGCLREMERVHRSRGDQVVGVGARIRNSSARVTKPWRLRLLFRVITRLRPGVYERSGISVPWRFLANTEGVFEGDHLPGCAMMWQARVVREVGFHEEFEGYALGEDLDFSLRARQMGKILLAGSALVEHLNDPLGRPDPYRLGYMEVYYRYRIHERALPDRTWVDVARFAYAVAVETGIMVGHLLIPAAAGLALKEIAGRLRGAYDLVRSR